MKKLILSLICLAAAWGAAAKVELPEIIVSGGKRTLSIAIESETLAKVAKAQFAPLADQSRHF